MNLKKLESLPPSQEFLARRKEKVKTGNNQRRNNLLDQPVGASEAHKTKVSDRVSHTLTRTPQLLHVSGPLFKPKAHVRGVSGQPVSVLVPTPCAAALGTSPFSALHCLFDWLLEMGLPEPRL